MARYEQLWQMPKPRSSAIHACTRFSDPWRKAVNAANAPKGTGFHSLRHYYASLLIRHGESVKVVQARLGHASAAETLDRYSHLWPDSEDQTREAVNAVLGISRPNRGPRSGPDPRFPQVGTGGAASRPVRRTV